MADANSWQGKAQLALQKGDEDLAREALVRKKNYSETAAALKAQLDGQAGTVDTMKKSLIQLEGKISEAKTKKDMLKSRRSSSQSARTTSRRSRTHRQQQRRCLPSSGWKKKSFSKKPNLKLPQKLPERIWKANLPHYLQVAMSMTNLAAMKQMLGGSKPAASLPQGTVSPTAAPTTPPTADRVMTARGTRIRSFTQTNR